MLVKFLLHSFFHRSLETKQLVVALSKSVPVMCMLVEELPNCYCYWGFQDFLIYSARYFWPLLNSYLIFQLKRKVNKQLVSLECREIITVITVTFLNHGKVMTFYLVWKKSWKTHIYMKKSWWNFFLMCIVFFCWTLCLPTITITLFTFLVRLSSFQVYVLL